MLIRTADDQDQLEPTCIVVTNDGVATQLNVDLTPGKAGGRYWTRTDGTYLKHPIPDRLLPATLIHPRRYGDEDVERAARAIKGSVRDLYLHDALDAARAALDALEEK